MAKKAPAERIPTGIEVGIKRPTGAGWPDHLKLGYWYFGGWWADCMVCHKTTGKYQNRDTLARWLRKHKKCGLKGVGHGKTA